MPIYEFYCRACHTVYNFFSGRIDTASRPDCPVCGARELPRRPSRFATLKHRGDDAPDPLDALDDSRLENAMDSLMAEMGQLESDEDPRAMARMMRRFGELTGLEMGEQMENLVERLESGASPDALEAEMDEALGDDDSAEDFFKLKRALKARRRRPPRIDETLYSL